MGFIKTFLIIAVVYYVVRFLFRVVIPIFLGIKNFNSNSNNKEGDVRVNNKKAVRKKEKVGEYIDFEEVED